MDFLKLLRTIEELLFEALSWLIFYPLTLWRVIRSPIGMMAYSDDEQEDELSESYSDTLSPGLFLILTLGLIHVIELAQGIEVRHSGALGAIAFGSDENLLATRSLIFGLYPLAFATLLLRAKGEAIDRNRLRAPFFAQCYLVALYALLVNVPLMSGHLSNVAMVLVVIAWEVAVSIGFVAAQAVWLRREAGVGPVRAMLYALAGFAVVLIVVMVATNVLA